MSHYVKRTEPGLWTVGHDDAAGKWHPASDHDNQHEAHEEAAHLNGGPIPEYRRVLAVRVHPKAGRRMVKVVLKSGAILGVEAIGVTISQARITGTLLGIEVTYPDGATGELEYINLSEVAAVMSEEI